jgi:hypothetical protein
MDFEEEDFPELKTSMKMSKKKVDKLRHPQNKKIMK